MSKLPPIPPEQRHFKNERADLEAHDGPPRGGKAGLQGGRRGANLAQQGGSANTRQNLTPQRSVQDR